MPREYQHMGEYDFTLAHRGESEGVEEHEQTRAANTGHP